jgi:hypothetical protein
MKIFPVKTIWRALKRRADKRGMTDPSRKSCVQIPAMAISKAGWKGQLAEDARLARFYADYPSLAAELPHHNPRNGSRLVNLKVTCEDCRSPILLQELHGVINDYPNCTEVRYVGGCSHCDQVVHNVLRMAGDEMHFIQDGKWCVSTERPWWHCLWPWPVDREW